MDKNNKDGIWLKQVAIQSGSLQLKEAEGDESFHVVSFHGSTFGNYDCDSDRFIRGAFTKSLIKKLPKLLWQHNMREPVGMSAKAYEDHIGLAIEGLLPKEDTLVKGRLMPQLRVKSIDSMSIGFNPTEYSRNEKGGYDFTEVEVVEVSFVTLAANSEAIIHSVKNHKGATPYQDFSLAPRDRRWDSSIALSRVRAFLDAEDAPNEKYKKAFLWYDAENAEDFAAYKLPYVDIIDNELKAVPRAIFAAAAAMEGARGGVDIPDADREKVKKNIGSYYSKMDMDSPFKSFSTLIEHVEKLADVERIIANKFEISKQEAKSLISTIARCKREAKQHSVNVDVTGMVENIKCLINKTTTDLRGE